MRLINTQTLQLTEFMPDSIPPYAILSHTWEDEEVTFHDLTQLNQGTNLSSTTKPKRGFDKIQTTCRIAHSQYNLDYAWVDTCCIDKSSSAELSEAINSMFDWYSRSTICLVYLSDFYSHSPYPSSVLLSRLSQCRWFTRGWTLQELIAPKSLTFFTSTWQPLGSKLDLAPQLSGITKISPRILLSEQSISSISVAQRMSWASTRVTTRPEDTAYCLLGILSVHMPLLYGEGGERAFARLQEEIIKETNDLSLFAWKVPPEVAKDQHYWGVLSPSPKYFASSHDVELWGDPMHNSECVWTSRGLRITPVAGGGLSFGPRQTYLLKLQCHRRDKREHLWILLEQHGCDVYVRVSGDVLREDRRILTNRSRVIYIRKTVDAAFAEALEKSHRYAVDFNEVIGTLETINTRLYLDYGVVDKEGSFDFQRGLWLMQGGRDGFSKLTFESLVAPFHGSGPSGSGIGNWRVIVGCNVHSGIPEAYLTFCYPNGRSCRGDALRIEEPVTEPYHTEEEGGGGGGRRLVNWLRVEVVEGIRDGQPVYVLVIKKGPAAKWNLLNCPVVRNGWDGVNVLGR